MTDEMLVGIVGRIVGEVERRLREGKEVEEKIRERKLEREEAKRVEKGGGGGPKIVVME